MGYRGPTPGIRFTLILFPVVTFSLGFTWFISPPERLQSPAFTAAEHFLPIHAWAVVFMTLAVAKLVILRWGGELGVVTTLSMGTVLYLWWAGLYFASIFLDPHTSLSAPILTLGWVGAHVAVLLTLSYGVASTPRGS